MTGLTWTQILNMRVSHNWRGFSMDLHAVFWNTSECSQCGDAPGDEIRYCPGTTEGAPDND